MGYSQIYSTIMQPNPAGLWTTNTLHKQKPNETQRLGTKAGLGGLKHSNYNVCTMYYTLV